MIYIAMLFLCKYDLWKISIEELLFVYQFILLHFKLVCLCNFYYKKLSAVSILTSFIGLAMFSYKQNFVSNKNWLMSYSSYTLFIKNTHWKWLAFLHLVFIVSSVRKFTKVKITRRKIIFFVMERILKIIMSKGFKR